MFIPKKSLNLEQEAFRLANVTDELSNNFISNRESIIQDIRLDPCSEYPIELVRLGCIPCDDVPIGSERGSGNVSGYVKVENKPACPAQWRPVRRVKVVIRGGFLNLKRDVVYTDDDGFFRSDKNFKNCTFKVCYRNDYGKVVDFQNGWQYFWNFMDEYTVHYPSWILSGGGTVDLFIPHSGIGSSQQNGDWCGAVIHNGLIEHNEMSTSQSIPTAPYLTVVLHKVKGGHHAGTVMGNYTIGLADFTTGKKFFESLGIFLSNTLTFGLLKIYTADVRFGYGRPPHDEPTFYNTDRYCEVVYHEFSHAQTPQRTGYFWYLTFGLAELNNPGPDPYGSCCQYNSDIISVGESYAYHMGHWMASTKWGECCTTFPEQGDIDNLIGVRYFSNAMGPTGNSHINFLEHFDPNWSADGAKWIPKGIMWDLIDGVGDPNGSNVRDNVPSGFFTNKKLFDGLGSDVKSMPQYKQKLLNMYSGTALNLIQAPIDTLFKDYKY